MARRLRQRNTDHGRDQRLVVCEDLKLPTFQQEPEVTDGGEGGQQLSVEGRVLDLCWRQLFGEKS